MLKDRPDIIAHLPNLQVIEMHDPVDYSQGSNDQPYAYVADRAQIGALDADMHKIMNEGPGIANVAMKSCVSLSHKGDYGAKKIAPSRTAKPQCELPTKRTVTNPVDAPLPRKGRKK